MEVVYYRLYREITQNPGYRKIRKFKFSNFSIRHLESLVLSIKIKKIGGIQAYFESIKKKLAKNANFPSIFPANMLPKLLRNFKIGPLLKFCLNFHLLSIFNENKYQIKSYVMP